MLTAIYLQQAEVPAVWEGLNEYLFPDIATNELCTKRYAHPNTVPFFES